MYRYYSKVRPIMIGGFPKSDSILEIVNFDEKKYDSYLGDYAYGYISTEEALEGYIDDDDTPNDFNRVYAMLDFFKIAREKFDDTVRKLEAFRESC